ncbi:amino acid ABC transporter permease [Lentibacter algarum]|uniref:amino acid ABC transporter permease n=1 Tax=Lentibacter algarum TaxID=576131 RepID=UPI001C0A5087|nr:amino acid ABC transporter permease [Lentibacter algarum]MBU2983672.1 amino acid ABC transporter permease [Lentibacter algarum]
MTSSQSASFFQSTFLNLRRDFFSSKIGGTVSLLLLTLLIFVLWTAFDWAILRAIWLAEDHQLCKLDDAGACWSVIAARWRLILFGLYPYDEHWRSALGCFAVVLTVVLSCIPRFWSAKKIGTIWLLGYGSFYILMQGGIFGLSSVSIDQWGGLALTVFVFASVAVIGMPLAVILLLMRRSEMPIISQTTGVIIDVVRALPLLTILFAAAVVLPFVIPGWMHGDKLYRVILGFALFFACYQAEILRGGVQAVAAGQEEAAKALGLSYWHRVSRIVLPQAFRAALPPTINQFVVTFKDTSIITIIGFFEILASGAAAFGSAEWGFAYVEVYVFIGLIYFSFVFCLSRYGAYLERRHTIATR